MRAAVLILVPTLLAGFAVGGQTLPASLPSDQAVLAALDESYQKAVERSDAATMDSLLADSFVLVDGDGDAHAKGELIAEAKSGGNRYSLQEDTNRAIRLFGDAAVVTANIHAKGVEGGEAVDYTLWFSATWVRTPAGWRCAFVQTSQPVEN